MQKENIQKMEAGMGYKEEFTNIARACRDGVRKVKAQLEF